MHDLLIALAFIGMVIAPAVVATNSRVEVEDDSDLRTGQDVLAREPLLPDVRKS